MARRFASSSRKAEDAPMPRREEVSELCRTRDGQELRDALAKAETTNEAPDAESDGGEVASLGGEEAPPAPGAVKAPEPPKRKVVEKILAVTLTDPERLRFGQDLARALGEKARLEGDLASVQSQYKGRIKEAQGKIDRLTTIVREGQEMRTVLCQEVPLYDVGEVAVVRPDTGEEVERRGMSAREMNLDLPLPDPPPATTPPATLAEDPADEDAGLPLATPDCPDNCEFLSREQDEEPTCQCDDADLIPDGCPGVAIPADDEETGAEEAPAAPAAEEDDGFDN